MYLCTFGLWVLFYSLQANVRAFCVLPGHEHIASTRHGSDQEAQSAQRDTLLSRRQRIQEAEAIGTSSSLRFISLDICHYISCFRGCGWRVGIVEDVVRRSGWCVRKTEELCDARSVEQRRHLLKPNPATPSSSAVSTSLHRKSPEMSHCNRANVMYYHTELNTCAQNDCAGSGPEDRRPVEEQYG